MAADVGGWPALLARVAAIEREWTGAGRGDERFIPFIPFPRARFITYLVDAMEAASGSRFLDVGCGPGTKIMLAQGFGLQGFGIDRDPDMAEAACANGVNAVAADALEWDFYYMPDILFVNRPCHGELQVTLEQRIMEQMKPGAVLICVNGAGSLNWRDGWLPVTQEWDAQCWVARKGLVAVAGEQQQERQGAEPEPGLPRLP